MKDLNTKIKETCMSMLKARLYEHELEKEKEDKNIKSKSDIGWGHQIKILCITSIQTSKRQ